MNILSVFAALITILSTYASESSSGFQLETRNHYKGRVFSIVVDAETLAKTPKWPAETPNPPFPPGDAIKKAVVALQALNADAKLGITYAFDAYSVSIEKHGLDRWIYLVGFKLREVTYPFEIVVLMDGTVPAIKELKGKNKLSE